MNKFNVFLKKLGASLKEAWRKFLVSLKKNPNMIPFVMLFVSFVVYSLNLTHVSNTTATLSLSGMGLCEFATMLFSILSMVCLLNAFPKRQKPNYPMIIIFSVLDAIIIFADVLYSTRISQGIASRPNLLPDALAEYNQTKQMITVHIVLMAATFVLVMLEPTIAKLLKMINTSVALEETNIGNIELSDEE